jgi:hypothetical protein
MPSRKTKSKQSRKTAGQAPRKTRARAARKPRRPAQEFADEFPARHKPPRNARAFVDAVFRRKNPVAVACKLLGGEDQRIQERVFEKLLEYGFGKTTAPAADASRAGGVHIVWDIPAPARETHQEEK